MKPVSDLLFTGMSAWDTYALTRVLAEPSKHRSFTSLREREKAERRTNQSSLVRAGEQKNIRRYNISNNCYCELLLSSAN